MKPEQVISAVEDLDFGGITVQDALGAVQMDTESDDIACTQFDIAEALYLVCAHCHGGQFSTLYAIGCQLGNIYNPGMGTIELETESAQGLYEHLCKSEGC